LPSAPIPALDLSAEPVGLTEPEVVPMIVLLSVDFDLGVEPIIKELVI